MNRFHVHLNVEDLDAGIRFYSALFAAAPTVRKDDYAKWMLDDPRVNFAISNTGSNTGRAPGIDHLGIQAETAEELAGLGARFDAAGIASLPENATVCCYAQSDKLWTQDPQGTRWETFLTFGDATTYHGGEAACATDGAGCTPDPARMKPRARAGGSCCAPASGCC